MGEDFISAKKERFNHERDLAVAQQFKTENLLSLFPDARTQTYRCALTSSDYKPAMGDRVVVTSLAAGTAQVLDANVVVGHLLPADAAKLIRSIEGTAVRMLAAIVQTVSKLNPQFTISIDLG